MMSSVYFFKLKISPVYHLYILLAHILKYETSQNIYSGKKQKYND